jgi:hypothetical protein
MASKRHYDSQGRTLGYEAEKDDMSASAVSDRMAKTRLGDKAKSASGAPKQEPGESAGSYAERYRKYRMSAKDQADMIDKRK